MTPIDTFRGMMTEKESAMFALRLLYNRANVSPLMRKASKALVREKVLIFSMVSDAHDGPAGAISFTTNSGKSLIVNQYAAHSPLAREKK